jgi:hypothetical protein
MNTTTKAKYWVGLAGAVVQAALQFVGTDGTAGHVLAIAAALLTAVGVYAFPNKPA